MEKINVAELLKDCPQGMELDCTMYDDVFLLNVDDREDIIFPIKVLQKDGNHIALTKYGQYTDADAAKCVIFPKGKTTWEGFIPTYKFKVGNKIRHKNNRYVGFTITSIEEDYYVCDANLIVWVNEQNNYELVPDKFDIATLKPFDRVLVRGSVGQKWTHDFFGFMDKDKGLLFVCVGRYVIQCIPYEGNEHLLGKTDDCSDYYKTWE